MAAEKIEHLHLAAWGSVVDFQAACKVLKGFKALKSVTFDVRLDWGRNPETKSFVKVSAGSDLLAALKIGIELSTCIIYMIGDDDALIQRHQKLLPVYVECGAKLMVRTGSCWPGRALTGRH